MPTTTVTTRRTLKRSRRPRRRGGVRRSLRRVRGLRNYGVHNFTRTVQLDNINVSALSNATGSRVFRLSDLPNYTEFTNLFQRFRINAVKITIMPLFTSTDANPTTTLMYTPNIHTVLDHDDNAVPVDLNEMMQYKNYKATRGNRPHIRYIKPAILSVAYETALASAYVPKWRQWLSTDDPATPYYAFKYFIDAISSGLTGSIPFRVYAKYYFQCKDLK